MPGEKFNRVFSDVASNVLGNKVVDNTDVGNYQQKYKKISDNVDKGRNGKLSNREMVAVISDLRNILLEGAADVRRIDNLVNEDCKRILDDFFKRPINKNTLAEDIIAIFPVFLAAKGYEDEFIGKQMRKISQRVKGCVETWLSEHPQRYPDSDAISKLETYLLRIVNSYKISPNFTAKTSSKQTNPSAQTNPSVRTNLIKPGIPTNNEELSKMNLTRTKKYLESVDFSRLVEETNNKVRGYSAFEKYLLGVDYDNLMERLYGENGYTLTLDNFTESDYTTLLSFAISIGCTIENKGDLQTFRYTAICNEDSKYSEIRGNRVTKETYIFEDFLSHLYSSFEVEGINVNDFHELKESIKKSLDRYNKANFRLLITGELDDLHEKSNVDVKDLAFNDYCKVIILAITEGCSIENEEDLEIFQRTLRGENTKYTEIHSKFLRAEIGYFDDECEALYEISNYYSEFSMEYYISRYQEAKRLIEIRESYGDTPITLNKTDNKANSDSNDFSGQEIASGLLEGNNSATLDSYKIAKSNIDSTEKATLRYSAFGVVFNNLFNQDDPVIQKLVSLKIDLRSEFSNYGIYNYEDEHAIINQAALKKFVEEVLQNGKLEVKEIDDLVGRINSIPENVNKNYEILCGNFHTDQKTFEKVAKIYALGEVIENIKKTFNESFEKKPNNIGEYTGLELDKEKPAEIVGDCLFLKGKLNGTDITIKYDLGSGKIFMNSFIQPSPYGDKISVGNTQPHTQIGRIDSFDRILEGYDSTSIIQPSEDSKEASDTGNHSNESEGNPVSAQVTQEKLTENKLLQNLQEIGKIASEKAESQAQKNSAVTNLLETFNILPSNFSLDFKKESNLFRALQIINNSNNESLVYFNDKFMPMVMDYCGLQRGKNNEDGCKVDKTNGDRYGFQHDKTRYEFTFDEKIKSNEDKEYENVRLIRKFADNFNTDPNRLKGKGNYDENYQPGFADFVKNEKIISGDKLNYKNMVTFIADLETSKRNYIDYKDHETAENVFTNRPPENSSDSLYA